MPEPHECLANNNESIHLEQFLSRPIWEPSGLFQEAAWHTLPYDDTGCYLRIGSVVSPVFTHTMIAVDVIYVLTVILLYSAMFSNLS